ncbi:DeoR family transcriptional regulator, glycerol-3-phosphate regulon repressor [Saccharopolyspora antimicrobica]|uniref:DeoR family transcriptional regulator n=1 Tax=Saccharopolyspora antimicrobica TaxID=455193 RepID=A0A1I4W1W3_9PSEU|nr:DeoR/GlpR family DNA-binding transcription regulator [Saccharopolyspora antimicrobica]RKT87109.1 DeoR family transcriptional regulator [Saccharopolyspora antimicrobica]SFN07462.1 DeoR family transcriptional regulator, glycerol-3-phosphate regulon repressor [Saccharopolyspora antimicrobica]
MLVAERHDRINQAIRSGRVISTAEFSELLKVSPETIRRDLAELESKGVLTRVRGGAVRTGHLGDEAPFLERSSTAQQAKSVIGRMAAQLVQPGQTVVIDVGTTAVELARSIPKDFTGVVATCSMRVATELADVPGVELHVSGGRMRRGDLALSGPVAHDFFQEIHADIAFLGSGGLAAGAGLTDFHLEECHARRAMIRNCAASYALVDSTKHQRVAPYRVAALDQLTGVVTDQEPPAELVRAIAEAGGRIIQPEDDQNTPASDASRPGRADEGGRK